MIKNEGLYMMDQFAFPNDLLIKNNMMAQYGWNKALVKKRIMA